MSKIRTTWKRGALTLSELLVVITLLVAAPCTCTSGNADFRLFTPAAQPGLGALTLSWESVSNALYEVDVTSALPALGWQALITNIVSQGNLTTITVPGAPASAAQFLRVQRYPSGFYVGAPDTNLNLVLTAPITTWDEAVPLGNGLLGGLLWGQGNLIRLSLDRGDLWDERPATGFTTNNFNYATMKSLIAAGNNSQFNAIFDAPYNDLHPTKIPAGRLEITLDPSQQVQRFELNLSSAEGRAWLANGAKLDAFFSAAQPAALVRIPGPAPVSWRLIVPASLPQLGYAAATTGASGGMQWFRQTAANGLSYCVCVGSQQAAAATLLAATVTSSTDGPDPLALAQSRVAAALALGYDSALAPHQDWWRGFWLQSSVSIPELPILKLYYLQRYFYGAASRRGAPPMPLQGVWTADAGSLPPWKGDYHNDLNTQMTYIGYHGAGQFDEGACYLDFLWNLLPTFRSFATNFYAAPGAAMPGVMSLAGQALGGWGQYSLSPTMGAWSGHLFYLHWRYTGDDQFLTNRALPWCREVGTCLRSLLVADTNGVLKLPLSTSPEIDDNSATSWLKPNSNFDYFCLKMLFLALEEMATAAGQPTEAAQWAGAASALGAYQTNSNAALKLDSVRDLTYSHRHLSNLMGIYPFNLITADGGIAESNVIAASLSQWDSLGTSAWCGYSFSWMSCLRARIGKAEPALRNLDIFTKAFVLRNGFHANGDQTGSGFSGFTYRPFTLEGNFLAVQAMHEMLLQSWNNTPGAGGVGVIRLFPATGWRWHDASFQDLRAEGGHRVSARRENNATTWFRLVAGRDGLVKIRDNFGGRTPNWSRGGVTKVGPDFQVSLLKGDILEATLPKPANIPPAPPDVAEPVTITHITANTLPFRIGADTSGGSRFDGDMARPALFNRALSDSEISQLATTNAQTGNPLAFSNCIVALDLSIRTNSYFANVAAALPAQIVGTVTVSTNLGSLPGPALTLDGSSYLTIAHNALLNCADGVTLSAWIRPHQLPSSGSRILDKTPVGAATAYLLDTYPGNSLRLITRDPWLSYSANLPNNQWSHVAATVDGSNGKQKLYLNGQKVAESN